jgi:class 3 adenylate cyclase
MFVNFIGLPEMIDIRDEKGERIYEEESVIASFNEAFAKLNAAVEKRGGMLKKVTYHLTGSDIVIYFGVPTAHSNDPMRAVSAALEIREIIMDINEKKIPALKPGYADPDPENKSKIYCQIGINTGPTFVAEFGAQRSRREYNVLGDTVNTTARLMGKADKNKILISEAVMKQVDTDKYECVEQEPMKLKGKSKKVKIYELAGRKDQKE